MSARIVPLRASSRLDHQARAPLPEPTTAPSTRAPRVTWLGDMLTPDQNSFGVVRMILALAVLVSHSIYLATGIGEEQPLYKWTNYTLGQHGVQVFFFLSGILVTQSLVASRSVVDFATARALRIFPALIVCVLLTALVLGPLITSLPPIEYLRDKGVAAYIAKTSVLLGSGKLPGVFSGNVVPGDINLSVWTLKYEAICYAILGVAGFFVLKMKRWREAAFALLAAWAALVLIKPIGLEMHGGFKSNPEIVFYFSVFFGMGVLTYALRQWIPIHTFMLIPLGALFWSTIGGRFQELGAAVFLGYLALWVATFRFGGLRNFTNANDYSYATYLYHYPVSQTLLHIWPEMTALPLILATTGITLWLAFFSWELVERPALALRHRLWKKTPHSAEAAFDAAIAAAKAGVSTTSTAANVATSQVAEPAAAAPASIVRQRATSAIAAAAAASARASERLVREMASQTASAKATVAATASAAATKVAAGAAATAAVASEAVRAKAPAVAAPMAATSPDREATPTQAPIMAPVAASTAAPSTSTEPGSAHVWRPMPKRKKLRILEEAPTAEGATDAVEKSRTLMPLNLIRRAKEGLGPQKPVAPVVETPPPPVPSSRIAFATKRPASADVVIPPPAPAPVAEPSRAVVAVEDEAPIRISGPRPTWTRPLGPQPAE